MIRVSQASPFPAGCGSDPAGVTLYEDTAVESYEAVNPANPSNVIGIWQQDRWSDGGAHGLVSAYSMDGGKTWTEQAAGVFRLRWRQLPASLGPWVSFSPNGTAYAVSISFTGTLARPAPAAPAAYW